jgi:hypothetical protein
MTFCNRCDCGGCLRPDCDLARGWHEFDDGSSTVICACSRRKELTEQGLARAGGWIAENGEVRE